MSSYAPITVTEAPPIGESSESREALEQGLRNAVSVPELDRAIAETDDENHPGVRAFEALVDEVAAELAPDVGAMMGDALQRRLPWTWTPDGVKPATAAAWRVQVLGTDEVNGQHLAFGFVLTVPGYQRPMVEPTEEIVARITAEQRAEIQALYAADRDYDAEIDVTVEQRLFQH